jgi:hypothetical protein
MSERTTYLGTGIGDLAAAKKYLRRKFRQSPLPPIVHRPGARFYVTARRGRRTAFLLGPYVSHMTALAAVPRAKAIIRDRDPYASIAVGTASLPYTVLTKFGR